MTVTAVEGHVRAAGRRGIRLVPASLILGFPRLAGPVVSWLVRLGVRPNAISSVGAAVLAAAAVAFGLAEARLGALCLLVGGALDILDGAVARRGGMTSEFGAFLDSTLDRFGEAVLYAGIAVFFQTAAGQAAPVLAMLAVLAALSGSLLVSYTRARAEGLGLECRLGLAQRAERVLGIGVPTLCFGAGPRGILLLTVMLLLAAASWVTVVQRVLWVYRATAGAEGSGRHGRR